MLVPKVAALVPLYFSLFCIYTILHMHYQNVVVVGQPSPVPQTTIVRPHPRANEYLALTLVLMVICFIHGNLPAFFCLVPALICSCVVSCTQCHVIQ